MKIQAPQDDMEKWVYRIVYEAWCAHCEYRNSTGASFEEAIEYCRTQTDPPITIGTDGHSTFVAYRKQLGKRYYELGKLAVNTAVKDGHKWK